MLRPRVIPCLLLRNNALVKTVSFNNAKYVGDPLNAVRIFNEKQVDELIVLDIDASVNQTEPNYKLISNLAAECRMPLCYGGGVGSVAQVERIISLGVEKIAISSAAVNSPNLITDAAYRVGSQSIVGVVDVKKTGFLGKNEVVIFNGTKRTGLDPISWSKKLQQLGAGEILLNSVDRDGVMKGYDLDLVESIRRSVSTPITVLGGAGSLLHIKDLFDRFGIIGASAGSAFIFKGKYRAVLISYPDYSEKLKLYKFE